MANTDRELPELTDQLVDDVLLEFFGSYEPKAPSGDEEAEEFVKPAGSSSPASDEGYSSPPRNQDLDFPFLKEEQGVAELLDSCPGCGGRPDKHRHYGGRGCHSCRAFFRRYVLAGLVGGGGGGQQQGAACPSEGSGGRCAIIPKSKKSCRRCRFSRCVRAGMKPEWVLVSEVGGAAGTQGGNGGRTNASPRSLVMVNKITAEEYRTAELLFTSMDTCMASDFVDKHKRSNGRLFNSFVLNIAGGTAFDFEEVNCLYATSRGALGCFIGNLIRGTPKTYELNKAICNFISMDLNERDRRLLLEHNVPLVSSYDMLASMGEDNIYFRAFIRKYLSTIKAKSEDDDEVSVIQQRLDRMHVSDLRQMEYDQLYCSPWAAEEVHEHRHRELAKKIFSWHREALGGSVEHDSPRDACIHSAVVHNLMELIIFFSTDFIDGLSDPERIQREQQKFSHLLFKYLKERRPNADRSVFSDFGKGLMMASYVREIKEIERKRLPV